MSKSFKALTGTQLKFVLDAAGQLRRGARESFFSSVAASLSHCHEFGDGDIDRAVRSALRELREERHVQL
jgi:hypothetical protein